MDFRHPKLHFSIEKSKQKLHFSMIRVVIYANLACRGYKYRW